jgi:hypothetical protein
MNRWKITALVFAGLFATSLSVNFVQTARAEHQPHMHAALSALETALTELRSAEHDKGGWRAAAARSTEEAIKETKRGIQFDNHH